MFFEDFLIHQPFDFGQLFGIHRGVVGEVEAQSRGFDDAAGLLDVRAQHRSQRGVKQMRGGVVAHVCEARVHVNMGSHHVALQ